MKLAIDVMGFENNIDEAIIACRRFQNHNKDVSFILVGKEQEIAILLKKTDNFVIHHADDVIRMSDDPMTALRKMNTSMYQAIKLVADNKADGVLSAGSTTVYVALVYYLLKLIPGINKPAFMPFLPTSNGRGFMMLDVGANKACTGEDLHQFAIMANIYCQQIRNISKPQIGVINIGTEDNKGFEYHQQANQLLKKDKNLDYVGFIETRSLLNGVIDIAIADGYTGNITLKALEGGLQALKNAMKKEYHRFYNWPAAICSLFVFKKIGRIFDYKNNAGALVIGLNKTAVKTHGSADCQQFYSSIRMLYDVVNKDVVGQIKKAIGGNHE